MEGGARAAVQPGGASGQRHAGRGARPVLRHAGAAEVHEVGARRGAGRHRGGQAPGHGASGGRLHPDTTRTASLLALRRTSAICLDGGCGAARRHHGPASSATTRCRSTRSARASPVGLRRPADLQPRQRRAAVSCSSTAARCATGCSTARCAPPTPISWPATAILLALFLDVPSRIRRRQRPSGQGRGAFPRSRPGARPDHRRPAPRARGRRPSRLDHGRRRGARRRSAPGSCAPPCRIARRGSIRRLRAVSRPRRSTPRSTGAAVVGCCVEPARGTSRSGGDEPTPIPARRRARPGARDLHRRPDRRRHRHRRSARRPRAAGL